MEEIGHCLRKSFTSTILNRYAKKSIILAADLILANCALVGALFLRLEPEVAWDTLMAAWPRQFILLSFAYLAAFYTFHTYRTIVRLAGLHTALRFACAATAGTIVHYLLATHLFDFMPLPRSVFIIVPLVLVPLSLFLKFSFRIYERFFSFASEDAVRTLVYGAGANTDRMLLSLIRAKKNFNIVGIIDDNPGKRGSEIHGIRVLGDGSQLTRLIRKLNIRQVVISIPSATGGRIRQITSQLRQLQVDVRILPAPENALTDPSHQSFSLRELRIEDLLRRPPRHVNRDLIRSIVEGKAILVTGGGGSIGSELVRQLASLGPRRLVVSDASEFALYKISEEITEKCPNLSFVSHLGNLADNTIAQNLFSREHFDIVFHACAYKHVPLVEDNVCAAVINNVGSAHNVFSLSRATRVGKVILISTDKAVRPTNAMGATKRICELLALWHSQLPDTQTSFAAVRFGNVLASAGSVIPKFLEQISSGGPVTVTHPDITRYFMLIPEAVSLVLQATTTRNSGEIYILNMGDPVRIADMASDLIELCGKRPQIDVSIEYTGLRPGEKLHEELNLATETIEPVTDDYSRITRSLEFDNEFHLNVQKLTSYAREGHESTTRAYLMDMVASYEADLGHTDESIHAKIPFFRHKGEQLDVIPVN